MESFGMNAIKLKSTQLMFYGNVYIDSHGFTKALS
jgi:hypothetical protein